jgi:fido (protein-threonine AMPylation protein)
MSKKKPQATESKRAVLAACAKSCEDKVSKEKQDDAQTASTTRSTPEPMAGKPRGRGKRAGGVSSAGVEIHAEFDGHGKRAGQSTTAGTSVETTRPLAATRELATVAGSLPYHVVAEQLAVNIAHCLDALLEEPSEKILISPEWICGIHLRIAGDLFPEWAGRFRIGDVQVGTHLPPPGHEVAIHIRNFCLDLEERLRHLRGAESLSALLAWADWRFQWIHPFKDFNGRVGRILLIALTYKLALPPIDPASDEAGKTAYFVELRAADAGDLAPLTELWLKRLRVVR